MNFLFYVLVFNSVKDSIGFFNDIHYYTVSKWAESCDSRWIAQDLSGLENDLHRHVFGQELAVDVVLAGLSSHVRKDYRKKPLVLNFHGWPGGGKGYVSEFIVKNWFKQGEKSIFMKRYLAKINFPLSSESAVYQYQRRLQKDLEETIRICPKAMFVFDEVDKYPPGVLDGIRSYLDYNTDINGLDFREAIFIFITNTGSKLISQITLESRNRGIPREELKLRHFDRALKTASFNEEGGFHHSHLIFHHLIDHVVPFLPLEKHHVVSCIEAEMRNRGSGSYDLLQEAIEEIMRDLTFSPPELQLFSTSGCKGVSEKVNYIIERENRKQRRGNRIEL